MALLVRRLIISVLIPYVWRRWRQRSTPRRDAERSTGSSSLTTATDLPG